MGTYLVRQLLDEGKRVRVLVRDEQSLPDEAQGRVEIVTGDLASDEAPDMIRRAVEDADTVLHLAAVARAWAPTHGDFHKVNVDAVQHLLEAALENEVERFVHVSTVLTLPPFRKAPVSGAASELSPYETTKLEGERLVKDYVASGKHAVIVHPTRVYGPGPLTDANAVSRVASMYIKGQFRIRLADDGVSANYVHAEDVARGIILASRHGKSGEHYILGGENASLEEFLEVVSDISGHNRKVFTLPVSVAMAVGQLSEIWGRLSGDAPLTRPWIRTFLEDRRVDIQQSIRDLGYEPRSLQEGLEETLAWLQSR